MSLMKKLVEEKTAHLYEEIHDVEGDMGDGRYIEVESTPVSRARIKRQIAQGEGLRILVGAGSHRNFLAVWAGDGDSNIGAIHETVADYYDMDIYDGHVPLEMTRDGKLHVTTTVKGLFDDPRDIEDALDRNAEFRKVFGTGRVNMSRVFG